MSAHLKFQICSLHITFILFLYIYGKTSIVFKSTKPILVFGSFNDSLT